MKKIRGWRKILVVSSLIFIFIIGFNLTELHNIVGINRVNTNAKIVSLTYDDGPDPLYTKPLLNLLEQYNIKATFFQVGKNIKKHPEITRLVLEKGHELANHTYSHKDMMFKKYDFLQKEINSTDQLLKTAGVTDTINFRPPWGRRFLVLIGMIYQQHKKIIIWDIDSEDYVKGISAETIANKVIKNIRPGAIILMHDSGGNRAQTIKATEIIINKLKPQGYQFKTVADLLKS